MANRADSPVPGAPLRQRPVSAPSSDRTHLGTATVAQTGPDASRRVGMSRIGNTPTCRIPFGEIPMHRDQSALQASLDPYRWQCQDAPGCAKRLECVELAPAFGSPTTNESASKLDAL